MTSHPIHSINSYMAMYPPSVPKHWILEFTKPGDLVADPFCGRGTTPVEAACLGRRFVAGDLNPLAVRTAQAKISASKIDVGEVHQRIEELKDDFKLSEWESEAKEEEKGDIGNIFHWTIIARLIFLRNRLLNSTEDVDKFILGILLGSMHGNSPTYLSVPMPNTFSMSPKYVERYVRNNGLERPNAEIRDVFSILHTRCYTAYSNGFEGWEKEGKIEEIDARNFDELLDGEKVDLIISSPPYLEVIKYGQYNWIKLWLLNEEAIEIDSKLDDTHKEAEYLQFMEEVSQTMAKVINPKTGVLCWVIGDVKHQRLAELVRDRMLELEGWKCVDIYVDNIPLEKKVTRIWNSKGYSLMDQYGTSIGVFDSLSEAKEEQGNTPNSQIVPIGNSGTSTPVDRILVMQLEGAKLPQNSRTKEEQPNGNATIGSIKKYLNKGVQWNTDISKNRQNLKMQLNRVKKKDMVRTLCDEYGIKQPNMSGSTVPKNVLVELHRIAFEISGSEEDWGSISPRKKKQTIAKDTIELLGCEFDLESDVSGGSTVTKTGLYKIWKGLSNKSQ